MRTRIAARHLNRFKEPILGKLRERIKVAVVPLLPLWMVMLAGVANSAIGVPAETKKDDALLGPDIQQLVVSIAPGWNSSQGTLQCFERTRDGWRPAMPAWPVLFGKNGLVWGRGVRGTQEPGTHKVEKDGRAPAGVFKIGKIYTYDRALPEGADYPFHTVTAADAWVDDVKSPDYNRFLTIPDPANPPVWFEKKRMRHNDFAYRWLVEIRHNADPPVAGAGSAIFFHIRRGPQRPTAGCTTMAEEDLVRLIRWLRAGKNPHYVLLPRSEYEAKRALWGLPAIKADP